MSRISSIEKASRRAISQVNELRKKRDGTLADLNAAMANLSKVTGEDDEETRDVIIKSDVRRDTTTSHILHPSYSSRAVDWACLVCSLSSRSLFLWWYHL
jgi:hypothetical protein